MREGIHHTLKIAGRGDPESLFTEEAIAPIYRYSGGVPRLINTICDSSLLVAFADDKTVIGPEEIESTAEELGWEEHEDTTGEHEVVPRLVPKTSARKFITRIDFTQGGEPVKEYYLEAGRFIIGRATDSEIQVNSKFVSRHHAQIVSSVEGCFVEDLHSTNGIKVNGKLTAKQLLADGDVISIDENQFVYHDLRDASGETLNKDTKAG